MSSSLTINWEFYVPLWGCPGNMYRALKDENWAMRRETIVLLVACSLFAIVGLAPMRQRMFPQPLCWWPQEMHSERWPGNVLLGTQSEPTPDILKLLSRPIENAIAFDHYQSVLNMREPLPWSILNHPLLLSWEFIPAWLIGRISLADNARIGILFLALFSLGLFSLICLVSLLSLFIFIVLDTLNSPGSSEEGRVRGR